MCSLKACVRRDWLEQSWEGLNSATRYRLMLDFVHNLQEPNTKVGNQLGKNGIPSDWDALALLR